MKLSKSGWRVVSEAVESGWGQTLRLLVLIVAFAVLLLAVLVCCAMVLNAVGSVGVPALAALVDAPRS